MYYIIKLNVMSCRHGTSDVSLYLSHNKIESVEQGHFKLYNVPQLYLTKTICYSIAHYVVINKLQQKSLFNEVLKIPHLTMFQFLHSLYLLAIVIMQMIHFVSI
jgi:hypothetical protein